MLSIIVIHGPNLNLLGKREKGVYGNITLQDVNGHILEKARALNVDVAIIQSNYEGEIISAIHEAAEKYRGIIINAGAYSHYSYAIMDAIRSIDIPVVEVHLSNIYAREEFRRNSVISSACAGTITGFGYLSYSIGLEGLISIINMRGRESFDIQSGEA